MFICTRERHSPAHLSTDNVHQPGEDILKKQQEELINLETYKMSRRDTEVW